MQYKYVYMYLRLSREDEDRKDESNSIQNQRLIIQQFIEKKHEFKDAEVECFVDDGYTGTNFNRPDFKRMMEQAKKKQSCCIIVKDLSRLGRDTIETQEYIEKVFPFLQIRFIAIYDSFDSSDKFTLKRNTDIKFKNLTNGLYPYIFSKNIKKSIRKRGEKGKFNGSMPPFGYLFKGDDHTSLIIDIEVSWIIRYIFDERLKGGKYSDIAQKLNDCHIITPRQHLENMGYGFPPVDYILKWGTKMVKNILCNPIYTGAVVNGKTDNMIVAIKSPKTCSMNDWNIVPNMHEAIVEKDEFERVLAMRKQGEFHKGLKEPKNIFRCKLKCGYCRRAMRIRYDGSFTKQPGAYCNSWKMVNGTDCYQETILVSDLTDVVLRLVRKEAALAEDTLKKVKAVNKTLNIQKLEKQIDTYSDKVRNTISEKMVLYEKFAEGDLSKTEYINKKERLSLKEQRWKDKKLTLEKQIAEAKEKKEIEQDQSLIKFAKYTELEELTYDVIQELIYRIYFYDPEHIEVVWNYRDEYLQVSGDI